MSERFYEMMESEAGLIFFFIVFILIGLISFYVYLWMREQEKDALTNKHRLYFEDAERNIDELIFSEKHSAEFFGRESRAHSKEGFTLCLIPSPDENLNEIEDRFESFQHTLAEQKYSLFSTLKKIDIPDFFVIRQDNLFSSSGQKFLPIDKILKKGMLSQPEKEKILLDLAQNLQSLHEKRTDTGETLYHGFLLPKSIFADIDESHRVKKVVISGLGLAFAFGPESIQKKIKGLNKRKLRIDSSIKNELLSQYEFFAPELKDPEQVGEIGPASDFYAFAALSMTLFTGKIFTGPTHTDWNKAPSKWISFLQKCLETNPGDRPKSFKELDMWLSDPEWELTTAEINKGNELHPDTPKNFESAPLVMPNLQFAPETCDLQYSNPNDPFTKNLVSGNKALKIGKWQDANKYFLDAVSIDPENPEANINLAISFYEIGDLISAENHYRIVKNINPELAKTFRRHIAFRM